MILELHCHTREHSACSHIAAADLVQSNFDKGLLGTVITDHHYLWQPDEIRELRSRVKVADSYLILAGQEVESPGIGHVLVYGADVSISAGTPLADIRARFPNAALIWAHPYRNESIPSREQLINPLINGIEIFNSNHTVEENNRGLIDWHRYKFIAVSGTDTHAISYTGLYPTFFDHPFSTQQELADEIRAGRCRPFFREIPRSGTSDTKVTEVSIGTAGRLPDRFIVRSHADPDSWRSSARSTEIIEEIRRHGFDRGPYRVPQQFAQDESSRTVIEQGIHGASLFDAIEKSGREEAQLYLRMAGEWLARLHNARLRISPAGEFLDHELDRLKYYVSPFSKIGHRQFRRIQEIMVTVMEMELALYRAQPGKMVQGHGDYHPKNIFIGRDSESDPSTVFVAAFDFRSSYAMPPAFDVGTFLAQFRNQFYENAQVLSKVSGEVFLEAYLQNAFAVDTDFISQVDLFRARTALSICYYLMKVGMGESENLWRVLVEAGQILTHLSVKSMGTTPVIEKTGEERKRA